MAAYRAAVVEGIRAAREILTAGDLRDAAADLRDEEAARREEDRDLAVLLDVSAEYGVDWPQRRAAALDRERAKQDRAAARLDRWVLADQLRRLVQSGGRSVRQGVAPSLPGGSNGSLAAVGEGSRRRARVRVVPDQRATRGGSTGSNAMEASLPRMQFTGAIRTDVADEPISLVADSWEEAVARLNHRYGRDREFVLRAEDGVDPLA